LITIRSNDENISGAYVKRCGLLLGNCYVVPKMFCLVFSQLPQCGLSRRANLFRLHRQSCERWVH